VKRSRIPYWVDGLAALCALVAGLCTAVSSLTGAVYDLVFYGSLIVFLIFALGTGAAQFDVLAGRASGLPTLGGAALVAIRLGGAPWFWGALGVGISTLLFVESKEVLVRTTALMCFVGATSICLGLLFWFMRKKRPSAS
jgi:hypothetical protein